VCAIDPRAIYPRVIDPRHRRALSQSDEKRHFSTALRLTGHWALHSRASGAVADWFFIHQ
jgi:hypothetical protein